MRGGLSEVIFDEITNRLVSESLSDGPLVLVPRGFLFVAVSFLRDFQNGTGAGVFAIGIRMPSL
jgi:hypothetical protein